MGRDIPGYERDRSLFSAFAQQRFSNRFASMPEIAGLRKLATELRAALGPEEGQELALKLTESLKGSQEQLTRFLATAKADVPAALRLFESADVEKFSYALAAVTMRQNELSQSTSALDGLFENLRDIWEDLAKMIAPVVRDIAGSLKSATAEGSVFRKTVIDVAEAGVSGIASLIDQLGGLNLAIKQAEFSWMGLFGGDDYDKLQLVSEIQQLQAAGTHRAADVSAYFAKLREKIDLTTGSMQSNLNAANEERSKLEGMATGAERAALAMARLDESIEMQSLTLGLHRARLSRFENDPLGFSESFRETYATISDINDEIGTLSQKLQAIESIQNQTREDRMQALKVETQINELMAERNRLLAGQRKGYLDAIQEQSLMSGRFSKIIITQHRGIALALDAGIAKANKLLGSVGTVSGIGPFGFGTNEANNAVQAAQHAVQMSRYMGVPTVAMNVPTMTQQALGVAVQSQLDRRDIESGATRLDRSRATGRLTEDIAACLEDAAKGIRKLDDGHDGGGGRVLPILRATR